jgi:tetratricopeptide (TPR) repeat protein
MNRLSRCLLAFTLLILASACRPASAGKAESLLAPCELALTAHTGDAAPDQEIARLQRDARSGITPHAKLERLGWAFIEKARLSYDAGYYKLAEQCARCLEAQSSEHRFAALLLRGHALHNLHRFSEAETLARELTEKRGLAFDYGLLSDALMEQGRIDEAISACQRMMNLKPGPQAFSRAAHLRWLGGDLAGAIEMMRMTANAYGPRDGEVAAWAWTKLALYEFQAGRAMQARAAISTALAAQPDYAPALLARGRMLLAEGKNTEAIASLEPAAQATALPEYLWWLAEALRAAGREKEAEAVESRLTARGVQSDARTLSLFLATRGEQPEQALKLAQAEMNERADVFTLDALAWAQCASGNVTAAWATMQRALKTGVADARLFHHAAIIAARVGQARLSRRYLTSAMAMRQMLTPGEKDQLGQLKQATVRYGERERPGLCESDPLYGARSLPLPVP